MKQPTTSPGTSQESENESRVLVTPCKKDQTTIELFHRSIKLKRPYNKEQLPPPPRNTTTINGFSESSRRNLRFTCINAGHLLASQFGLSYGQHPPTDGRICKRHLKRFLVELKRAFPFIAYLWIMEFQSRGALHFHVYLNIPTTDDNRLKMATLWCNIVNAPDKDNMMQVHNHPKNFITWKMHNGSYIVKYLDKAAQKTIPANFTRAGRFWGTSHKLIGEPETLTTDDLAEQFPQVDTDTGEIHDQDAVKFLLRTVGRHHEKNTRKSWFRNTGKSTSSLTGAPIYRQTLQYLLRIRNIDNNPSPF